MCLEEALAGKANKKGGEVTLFLNSAPKRKLPWRPKTKQAAAQAQIELRVSHNGGVGSFLFFC